MQIHRIRQGKETGPEMRGARQDDPAAKESVPLALRSFQSWQLGHLLDPVAESRPDAAALVVGSECLRVTYDELAGLVAASAHRLAEAGLGAGDRVALRAGNTPEFVVGLLAAARSHLVVVPVDPALSTAETHQRIAETGARVVLVDPDRRSKATDAPTSRPEWTLKVTLSPEPGGAAADLAITTPAGPRAASIPGLTPDDVLIMFTGGTTARPKMVPWTHENIAASLAGVVATYGLGPDDATVAVMPMFHGHGLIAGLLATLASGGLVLLPAQGKFSAHTFWEDAVAAGATWYTAVPTIHKILLARADSEYPGPDRAPRLRFIRSCSAPLNPVTAHALQSSFGAQVLSAYGMTETTHQATSMSPAAGASEGADTVGRSSGVQIRIVGDDNRPCPVNVTGEVWLRGRTVVRGYLDNPAETARSFTDGWFHTGDLGSVDADGVLTLTGRIKELINRGGEKISPEHVEEVLGAHAGIGEAAVFGIPDPLYGERVNAAVVADPGASLDQQELHAYCKARLSAFEVPDEIAIVASLPHTAKGSIDRGALLASYGR